MNNDKAPFIPKWIIGPGILLIVLTLLAGCGRGDGGGGAPQPVIEAYTGPCLSGQASWDCMAWDQANWE